MVTSKAKFLEKELWNILIETFILWQMISAIVNFYLFYDGPVKISPSEKKSV